MPTIAFDGLMTAQPTIVKLPPPAPCPDCGVRGAHYCTGGQPQHGGWIGAVSIDKTED